MKLIESRRSVRAYLNKDVEEEKLASLLESARLSPSGTNTQPWVFIVVKSQETKERIIEVDHNQTWMAGVPLFIVCVADSSSRIENTDGLYLDEQSPHPELKQTIRDTAIACENILLEAENQGLAACWTAWFEQKDLRPILGIPDDKYVCGVITVGYAAETPPQRPRKSLEDIVKYEKW